jgi:hypothetical protein
MLRARRFRLREVRSLRLSRECTSYASHWSRASHACQSFTESLRYAVIFTDVEAPPLEIGIQPWEIVGRHGLNSGVPALLLKAVKHQRARHQIVCSPAEPQPALLRKIRDLLRPDFERVVANGTIIGDSERRLLRLTEEQYDLLLDPLAGNRRCLFELQPKLALVNKEALENAISGRPGSSEDYRLLTSSLTSRLSACYVLTKYVIASRKSKEGRCADAADAASR